MSISHFILTASCTKHCIEKSSPFIFDKRANTLIEQLINSSGLWLFFLVGIFLSFCKNANLGYSDCQVFLTCLPS